MTETPKQPINVERRVDFYDALVVFGILAIVGGVAIWSKAAAVVLLGVFSLTIGLVFLMAKLYLVNNAGKK